jgi:hypothetical protein
MTALLDDRLDDDLVYELLQFLEQVIEGAVRSAEPASAEPTAVDGVYSTGWSRDGPAGPRREDFAAAKQTLRGELRPRSELQSSAVRRQGQRG